MRVATIMVELALTPPVKEVLALLDGAGAALNVKLPPGTVEGAGAALNVKPPPETVEGAGVPPNVKPLPATVEGAGVPPNENLLSGFALLVNVWVVVLAVAVPTVDPSRPLVLARSSFGRSAVQDTHLLSVPLLIMSHEAHLQDPAATVPKPLPQLSANLSKPSTCLVVSDIPSPAASLDFWIARNLRSSFSLAARCFARPASSSCSDTQRWTLSSSIGGEVVSSGKLVNFRRRTSVGPSVAVSAAKAIRRGTRKVYRCKSKKGGGAESTMSTPRSSSSCSSDSFFGALFGGCSIEGCSS